MLSVWRTVLGNICHHLLILILILGLSCRGKEWGWGSDGSLIPVFYPLSPPVAGALSKAFLVAPQVNPHPLMVLSLLKGTPCLFLFLLTLGFVQPKRKEPPWISSTDLCSSTGEQHFTQALRWGTPMLCSAAKQSCFIHTLHPFFGFLAVPAHWADDFRELSAIHFLVATISKFSITYTQLGLFFLGWISSN